MAWVENLNMGEFSKETEYQLEYLVESDSLLKAPNLNVNHPFFAFGEPADDGNLIFEKTEFYKKRDPKSNIVAVHGGSVARNLFLYNKLSDVEYLSNVLGIKINKAMNFSARGARQPRALNISTIYGQAYNISINIEGRNEVIPPIIGNFPPYFPNTGWVPNLYFGKIEDLSLVGNLRLAILDYLKARQTLDVEEDWGIATVRAWRLAHEKWAKRRVINYFGSLDTLEGRGRFDDDSHYSVQARMQRWIRFSCMQQNIQNAMGIRSFFAIQPKPQFFKQLSPEESKFVEVDEFEASQKNYQSVVGLDVGALRKAGFEIISMLRVFENVKKTVYIDSCCHMTSEGYDLFLESLLKEIRKRLEARAMSPHCDLQKVSEIVGY